MSRDLSNTTVARNALADPATSGEDLATIAELHPGLAVQIAAHPNIYPELRDWLRQNRPSAFASTATPMLTGFMSESDPPNPSEGPPPDEQRRGGGFLLGFLIAIVAVALAVGGFALVSALRDSDGDVDTDSLADGAAASDSADPPTSAASTDPAPASPTEAATPAPETTSPTQASPSSSTAGPGAAPAELSAEYCGTYGTLSVLAETERFEVAICREDPGLFYFGSNKETGDSIRLEAYMPDGQFDDLGVSNFLADNGVIMYRLTEQFLIVYESDEIVMQEAVTSWRSFYG